MMVPVFICNDEGPACDLIRIAGLDQNPCFWSITGSDCFAIRDKECGLRVVNLMAGCRVLKTVFGIPGVQPLCASHFKMMHSIPGSVLPSIRMVRAKIVMTVTISGSLKTAMKSGRISKAMLAPRCAWKVMQFAMGTGS